MKKQRPTIPIFEWRVAINLEATRDIQNQVGTPAYGCECEDCQKWKSCFKDVLPENIQHELKRIGVEIENPTDLYQFQEDTEGSNIRVVYHAVGKILSGPNQWKNDSSLGDMLMYHTVRESPYTSIVVFPQNQSFDASPILNNQSAGELIRIDFRLLIPSSYSSV